MRKFLRKRLELRNFLRMMQYKMSTAEKALAKILSGNSDKNVSFAELKNALSARGWKLDRIRGSHHSFISPTGELLTVPVHGKVIKPAYVKQAREYLK